MRRTCGSKPMVPRPAAVTETVLPSLPTRLMPTIGTFADPANGFVKQRRQVMASEARRGWGEGSGAKRTLFFQKHMYISACCMISKHSCRIHEHNVTLSVESAAEPEKWVDSLYLRSGVCRLLAEMIFMLEKTQKQWPFLLIFGYERQSLFPKLTSKLSQPVISAAFGIITPLLRRHQNKPIDKQLTACRVQNWIEERTNIPGFPQAGLPHQQDECCHHTTPTPASNTGLPISMSLQ